MAKTFGVEVLATDHVDTSGAATLNDVTGLSFRARQALFYTYKFMLAVTASVTTRGFAFGINASPTTTPTMVNGKTTQASATTEGTDSFYEAAIAAFGDVAAAPGDNVSTLVGGNLVIIEGLINPSAAQDVFPQLRPEAVAGTITTEASISHCLWREL